MPGFASKTVMVVSLCGVFALSSPALAQSAGAEDVPAGAAAPAATDSPPANDQTTEVASAHLGQGTKAEAEHSAEATAHKSVSDPNNQLGTSLQGRTRPIAGADVSSQSIASGAPPAAGAQ